MMSPTEAEGVLEGLTSHIMVAAKDRRGSTKVVTIIYCRIEGPIESYV